MKMSLTKKKTQTNTHCVENTTTETNSARSLSRKNSQFSVSKTKKKHPKNEPNIQIHTSRERKDTSFTKTRKSLAIKQK